MDLEATKIDVMQKVMGVSKLSLLNKINSILEKEMIVGYTADGQPLTREMYDQRLQNAEKQLLSGDYINQSDLEQESENW